VNSVGCGGNEGLLEGCRRARRVGQLARARDSRKPCHAHRVWSVAWLIGSRAKSFFRGRGRVADPRGRIQADALAPGRRLPDPLRCDGKGGVLRRDAVWRNAKIRVWFAL
jgi:hypothetical protein